MAIDPFQSIILKESRQQMSHITCYKRLIGVNINFEGHRNEL